MTTYNQAAEKWRLAIVTGDTKAAARWKAEMDRLASAFKAREAEREAAISQALAPTLTLEPQQGLEQRQRIAYEEYNAALARGDVAGAQRWAREVARSQQITTYAPDLEEAAKTAAEAGLRGYRTAEEARAAFGLKPGSPFPLTPYKGLLYPNWQIEGYQMPEGLRQPATPEAWQEFYAQYGIGAIAEAPPTGLYAPIALEDLLPGWTTTWTPDYAANYGIELPEGYLLEVFFDPDTGEYVLTTITPDGWRISQDGIYTSPEGETYTLEEMQEIWDRTEQLEGAIEPVFPEQELQEVSSYIAEQPEQFLADIVEIGRDEQTEALLRELGMTDAEIDALFAPAPPTFVPEKPLYEVPVGFYFITEQPFSRILELSNKDPNGVRQAILFEGRTPETERLALSLRQFFEPEAPPFLGGEPTPDEQKFLNKFFLDDLAGKFMRGAFLPDALADYWKIWFAGLGDVVESVAGLADRVGADSVSQVLHNIGASGQLAIVGVEMGKRGTPEWYAKNLTRMIPLIQTLVIPGLKTVGWASALARAAGAGTFLARTIGTIAGSVAYSVGEGVIEAGAGYNEAERRGFSQEEQNTVFDKILRENVALLSLTNTAQFVAAFLLPGGSTARLIVKGLGFGFGAATEGFEEVAQLGITRSALGDEVLVFDDEFWDNFKLGMAGGLLFQGVITTYAAFQNRVEGRMTPPQKQTFDQDVAEAQLQGLSRQEAEGAALDKFAETPEGEAIVTEAVEEIIAEEKAEAIPDIVKVEEAIAPIVEQVQPITTRADSLAREHAPAATQDIAKIRQALQPIVDRLQRIGQRAEPAVIRRGRVELGETIAGLEKEIAEIDERLATVKGKPAEALQITRASLQAEMDIATTLAGSGPISEKIGALRTEMESLQETLGRREIPFGRDLALAPFRGVPNRILDAKERVYRNFFEGLGERVIPELVPLELTPAEYEANLAIPGSPEMSLDQANQALELFGSYIEGPAAPKAWELTKQLRRETLAQRVENLKARAQEFVIEQGIPAEEAMDRAIRETMSGQLPDVRIDFITDMTQAMRDALFAKVYHTLKAEPFEMMSTAEALTNALLGKPIPREPGVKGGSAFSRLQRVFGDQPAVIKAIDTVAKSKKTLPEWVEGVFRDVVEGGIPPTPLDPDMVAYLRAVKDLPFVERVPFVRDLTHPLELEFAKTKMELALRLAKGEITQEAHDSELTKARERAYPPLPPVEPPIAEGFQQMPMIPEPQKHIFVRALKEIGATAVDIGNFMRANMASFDFSFWRQQAPLILNNKRAFIEANIEAWKAMWSQKAADASWERITRDPLYQLYEEIDGGFLRPPFEYMQKGTARWKGMEEFGFPTQERPIPRFTQRIFYIKISARGFGVGTNEHNWRIFKNHYRDMLQVNEKIAAGEIRLRAGEGFSITQEMKDFERMLADFTGRARLGKLGPAAPALSAGLFAPRLILGRILTPRHLVSANPYVRKAAWKNLVTFVGGMGAIIVLGAQLGLWDVEKDPRSPNFGQIRIGKTRIDPWGGYRPFVVFLARVITKTGLSGDTGAEYAVDPLESTTWFVRSKASPLAGVIADFWTGKTFIGEEVDVTNVKQWIQRIAPFAAQDIYEAYQESPTIGLLAAIPGLLGASVMTYSGDWKENFTKLGIPKYSDSLPYGITEPVYDVKDFWADTAARFKGVDPETLTEEKGYPPYLKAMVEAARVKETLALLANQSLVSLNADPAQGATFVQYYMMWLERERIVASGDEEALRAFDADERTRNAHLGNMTQRQYALLAKYHTITDEAQQAEFLAAHPELDENPRDEWLKAHPEENAKLAIWGQEDVLTQEAYDIARRLIEEFDIPDNAVNEYLPPAEIAEAFFGYQEIPFPFSGYEREWFLQENPEFFEWGKTAYGWEDIDFDKIPTPQEFKWFEEYDALPDDRNTRAQWRWDHPEADAAGVRLGKWTKSVRDWWSPPEGAGGEAPGVAPPPELEFELPPFEPVPEMQ